MFLPTPNQDFAMTQSGLARTWLGHHRGGRLELEIDSNFALGLRLNSVETLLGLGWDLLGPS